MRQKLLKSCTRLPFNVMLIVFLVTTYFPATVLGKSVLELELDLMVLWEVTFFSHSMISCPRISAFL